MQSGSVGELDGALRLADDEIPVAVGGDGSLNALVTLMDKRAELDRTLAVVPFGTGNATAHTLGLHGASVALRALEQATTRAIDIIRTNIPRAPIALVSCSTGFESRFLQRYGALRYGSRQWAGWSALFVSLGTQTTGVGLTVDGREWVSTDDRVHNVGVYNIPHYAFGKVMWRGVRADDGLGIAARVSSSLSYWHLMIRGVSAPREQHTTHDALPGVRTTRWHAAELRSPLKLQVDGEFTEASEASLRVQPRAVTVICATNSA